jgi:hypothetical protein
LSEGAEEGAIAETKVSMVIVDNGALEEYTILSVLDALKTT